MTIRPKALILTFAIALMSMPAWAQDAPAPDMRDLVNGYESATTGGFKGIPSDWSSHHLIFSKPSTTSPNYDKVQQDPRYWIQNIRRALDASAGDGVVNDEQQVEQDEQAVSSSLTAQSQVRKKSKKLKKKNQKKIVLDWTASLGAAGATNGKEMYPAKFSFDINNAAQCDSAGTPDFIVYNTSLAGSATTAGTQASILAFDNLYSACSGTAPLSYWAYNTHDTTTPFAPTVLTSPVLSLDGSQVAFVQSQTSVAHLVLLKWKKTPATHSFTATTASGTPNLTVGTFVASDIGAQITAASGITAGTTIIAVTSGSTATMSANASASGARTVTINEETAVLPGVPLTVAPASYRACAAPCMTNITFSGNPNDTNSSPFVDYSGDNLYVGADDGTLHKFTGVFAGTPGESGGPYPKSVHAATVLSSPVFDSVSGNIYVGDAAGQLSCVVASTAALTSTTTNFGATHPIVDGPIADSSLAKVYWFAGSTGGGTYVYEQTDATTALGTVRVATAGGSAPPGHTGAFDKFYLTTVAPNKSGFLYVCSFNSGQNNGTSVLTRIGFSTAGLMNTSTGSTLNLSDDSIVGSVECSPITEQLNGTADRLFMGQTAKGNRTGCTGACAYAFSISRTVTDAVTNGTTTVTSATAAFVAADIGAPVSGTNIPLGATIVTQPNATTITISATATGSASGGTLTISTFPSNAHGGLASGGGTSGIVIDNVAGTAGASQFYYSQITGALAVQASQGL